MSITLEGNIKQSTIGMGAWTLVTPAGETYEIYRGAPQELLQDGLSVKVQGTIREDIMTLAMIGPVLQVDSFEIVSS
ncbi:MAG: hypothetical protein QNJ46_12480 [Leptolyngbyaceae cyanobacterium MO_188.B28]|nr:hypothetical protein [Leptolyngbyaceae cyanobacterium MO_188.B28]